VRNYAIFLPGLRERTGVPGKVFGLSFPLQWVLYMVPRTGYNTGIWTTGTVLFRTPALSLPPHSSCFWCMWQYVT